jgi:hypothetical protein
MDFKKIKEDLIISFTTVIIIKFILLLIAKGYAITIVENLFKSKENK